MKTIKIISLLVILQTSAHAQNIQFSKSGYVRFFSSTPLENIEAITNEATSFLNTQKGEIIISLLIKSFRFEKALMEEHFNENYMESDQFPKGSFKGTITNLKEINFNKDGNYTANISGDLTIHGVTRPITTQATLSVKGGKLSGVADFNVKPADYGIKIPALVRGKIAEIIEIQVKVNYEPYKK